MTGILINTNGLRLKTKEIQREQVEQRRGNKCLLLVCSTLSVLPNLRKDLLLGTLQWYSKPLKFQSLRPLQSKFKKSHKLRSRLKNRRIGIQKSQRSER
jgi:hypothetical protein